MAFKIAWGNYCLRHPIPNGALLLENINELEYMGSLFWSH